MTRIQFNIRLDKYPDLYEAIRNKAEQEGLSLNDFAVRAFQQALGWETEQPSMSELEEMLAKMLAPMQQRLEELERQVGESKA
jgi:CRP-like cAMP-binding protein